MLYVGLWHRSMFVQTTPALMLTGVSRFFQHMTVILRVFHWLPVRSFYAKTYKALFCLRAGYWKDHLLQYGPCAVLSEGGALQCTTSS